MGNIIIEICMISAWGLPRSSSLWKQQWFCVGWIDPNQKYCSKLDSSGTTSPTWRTKFSASVDERKLDLRGLTLSIEVHSREQIFLREKLYGAVKIPLKEFLIKYIDNPEAQRTGIEEVASFQLRKKNSGKPQGFVDVSIRISDKELDDVSLRGTHMPHWPSDKKSGISLAIEDELPHTYPKSSHYPVINQAEHTSSTNHPYAGQRNLPYMKQPLPNYSQPQLEIEQHIAPAPPPPPPPPPQNVGFISPFFPTPPQSYAGMSSNKARGHAGVGFGAGVGVGALTAGAVIFGDDFIPKSTLAEDLGRGCLSYL